MSFHNAWLCYKVACCWHFMLVLLKWDMYCASIFKHDMSSSRVKCVRQKHEDANVLLSGGFIRTWTLCDCRCVFWGITVSSWPCIWPNCEIYAAEKYRQGNQKHTYCETRPKACASTPKGDNASSENSKLLFLSLETGRYHGSRNFIQTYTPYTLYFCVVFDFCQTYERSPENLPRGRGGSVYTVLTVGCPTGISNQPPLAAEAEAFTSETRLL